MMFGFVSRKKYEDLRMQFYMLERDFDRSINGWDVAVGKLDAANARLAKIAAMETPNCASIGKRMARVARGEG